MTNGPPGTENSRLHIFDIERFAIHDGPGIRSVVFLQGCPLRCPWCANPESWQTGAHLMYIESKCVKCGRCRAACPSGLIQLLNRRLRIDRGNCTACALCAEACPNNALCLTGKTMSISEILHIVMRDAGYYRNSGGGITLSGGEPFTQFEEALSLLRESKKAGLHTVVETTGNINAADFSQSLSVVDLYLFDIKHHDPDVLKKVTGGDVDTILYNLRTLSEQTDMDRDSKKIILRIPVIPGFNYAEETINGIYKIALDYNIHTLHLLPYHTLGKNKFHELGLAYPYQDDIPMLKPEQLLPLCELGKKQGLDVKIS